MIYEKLADEVKLMDVLLVSLVSNNGVLQENDVEEVFYFCYVQCVVFYIS